MLVYRDILSPLQRFPKGSSPRSSQLRAQLDRIRRYIPELFGWVQYSTTYQPNSDLDLTESYPLVYSRWPPPLLVDFSQTPGLHQHTSLQIWYLDDGGTIIGPRAAVADLFTPISQAGPQLGITTRVKYSGPQATHPFQSFCLTSQGPLMAYGSPIWGNSSFYQQVVYGTRQLLVDDTSDSEDGAVEPPTHMPSTHFLCPICDKAPPTVPLAAYQLISYLTRSISIPSLHH